MFADVVDRVAGMSPGERLERLRELDAEMRRVEAEVAAVVEAVDHDREYAADGHASIAGWARAELRWSGSEITGRRRLGRLIAEVPMVGEAVWSGRLSVAQARELARVRANPRIGDELPDLVEGFVASPLVRSFEDFRLLVRRWEHVRDVDGAHRDAEMSHRTRTLTITDHDGVGHVTGHGGAVDTAELIEIWSRYCDAEFAADWDATVAEFGDDASVDKMPRTHAQRRWDALIAIARDAAATPADARRPEPTLNITMSVDVFEATLARMRLIPMRPDAPYPSLDHLPVERWRCETSSGILVDPVEAIMTALHGHVRRVVFDSAGNVIDLGRRRRLFTGSARDAVRLQATRCIWPGCDRPVGRCQIDHTTEWHEHGPTCPDNGGPGCARHNVRKHHGYRAWRDPDGIWHTYRPDGTEIGYAG